MKSSRQLLISSIAIICIVTFLVGAFAFLLIARSNNDRKDKPRPITLDTEIDIPAGIHTTSNNQPKTITVNQKGINVHATLGNDQIDASDGRDYLLVTLSADEIANLNAARTPLNLAIVVDRSGSMAGEKLEYVKNALVSLADLLHEEDRVALVIYDDSVSTIYSKDYFDRADYLNAVEEIMSGGSTNLEGGLRAGLTEVLEQINSDYANRVILLSDGLANVGISDADSLAGITEQESKGQITVSTIGVGADYDEKIMTSIATAGRGNYYFLENPADAERIFDEEFKTLTEIVASDISVQFDFHNQFVVTRGIGYDLKTDGYFEPFDIYSGRSAKYLFQIDKRDGNDLNVDEFQDDSLLGLTVTFTSKLDGSEQTIEIPLDTEIVNAEVNPLASDIVYKEFINSIKSEELWTIYEDLDKVDNETARRNLRELIEFYNQANARLEGSLDSDIQILEEKYKYLESLGEDDINIEYSGRIFQKSNQNDSYRDKYNK